MNDTACVEKITVFDLVDRIQNVVKDCEGMSNNIKSLILGENPETEFETKHTNNAEIKQSCLILELNYILTDLAKLATNLQLIQRSLI